MREIEFRGLDETNNWVYGSLIKEYIDGYFVYSIYTLSDEKIKVNEQTVGQYTGLRDKDGRKVFEGDIVVATYSREGSGEYVMTEKVEWCDQWNAWCLTMNNYGVKMYRRLEILSIVNDVVLERIYVLDGIYDY